MVVQKTNKWSPTSRKTTLEDGSTRVLYKNPMFPGEVRVRKMRKGRDGRMTASYVKKGQHGGSYVEERNACRAHGSRQRQLAQRGGGIKETSCVNGTKGCVNTGFFTSTTKYTGCNTNCESLKW